jgi:hypothetical protein
MFLNRFVVIILKLNFKKIKNIYYFNIFEEKRTDTTTIINLKKKKPFKS